MKLQKINVHTRLHKSKRLKILEGIAKGEQAILEGRVLTHTKAKEKLKKWIK